MSLEVWWSGSLKICRFEGVCVGGSGGVEVYIVVGLGDWWFNSMVFGSLKVWGTGSVVG